MIALDANGCELRIYVRRAGLLKRFGHDLELRLGALRGDIDPAAREDRLEIDAGAIRVVSAVEGRVRRPALSASDVAEIERNIAAHVLGAEQHPRIEFCSARVEPTAT